ncbi:unnamed protein product [Diabrotica balteata]|uniref:Farnesol dehydrogenase n=1 Tax=Diabrotica balteata TaxID=107213 RepID=A0A9N9XFV4_DIABA|nr:unnamed protein product [Diabrotica balteata]
MERWAGSVAFVTGASSGIGEAVVQQLVDSGLKVVGFARRKQLLDQLAKDLSSKKGKFYTYEGDVSKESDVLKAYQWTKENVGPVSIVINNAGAINYSKILESTTEKWRQVLDVNVLGVCISTREAIKHMKENNIDGHVINLNSVLGHKVGSMDGDIYGATKYAVTSLTETLRLELAKENSKIRVTSISPGAVQTETLDKVLELAKLPPGAVSTLAASDIADAIIYVLSAPQSVNVSELIIQVTGEIF